MGCVGAKLGQWGNLWSLFAKKKKKDNQQEHYAQHKPLRPQMAKCTGKGESINAQ